MRIPNIQLSFGNRFETHSHDQTFDLDNGSLEAIDILSLSGNCDCQNWSPAPPFTIAAHDKQTIRVRMALSIHTPCARSNGLEMAQIPIRVAYSVRKGPVQFQDFTLSDTLTPNLVVKSVPK